VPIHQIRELVKEVNSLVVVDEAYQDFGGETSLPLLKEYPNLIILRTFSKIGLAGLRVGYLAANRDVTLELSKVKQPYNVNTVSQKAACAVLDNWNLFREQIAEITAERERVAEGLRQIPGVKVHPSCANFILFSVPVPPADVHQRLVEGGILIRKGLGHTHGLENCLRVTIGSKQENDLFLEKLNENCCE
jgi:histidinol-phosphate aminotransferase